MKEYLKDDVAAVLQYFKEDFVPKLEVTHNRFATGHTESLRYAREYAVAYKLKLNTVRNKLAGTIVTFETDGSLKPSPCLIGNLSNAGLHSSALYDSMMRLIAQGMKNALYQKAGSLELQDAYSRVVSRWAKLDLLILLGHIGSK